MQLVIGPHRDHAGLLGRGRLPREARSLLVVSTSGSSRPSRRGISEIFVCLQAEGCGGAPQCCSLTSQRRSGRAACIGIARDAPYGPGPRPSRRRARSRRCWMWRRGAAIRHAGDGHRAELTPTETETTTETENTGTETTGTETTETTTTETTPRSAEGRSVAGKAIFLGPSGCTGCHTLADAGSTGNVGPNLDDAHAELRSGDSTA